MRLFVALDLPDAILQSLDALIKQWRPLARIQWSPVSNLHITTKFIGEWPEAKLAEMKQALRDAPRGGAFEVSVEGVGWFPPKARSPRVLFAGVKAPPALYALARATDSATASLGVAKESREFQPHLTLARIKNPLDLTRLQAAVSPVESKAFGAFEARSQFLYSSKLTPAGSIYTKLEEFAL
jgi:RNA 2',3'-cyclic 3'-phosphodiesterase